MAIPSSDRILKKMLDLEIYPTLYAYSMAKESCTSVKTPSQEARVSVCCRVWKHRSMYQMPDIQENVGCWIHLI